MTQWSLDGKIALVTGGARGIGAATADSTWWADAGTGAGGPVELVDADVWTLRARA